MTKYTIGIDYGTDSVRSVIINTENGRITGSSVWYYEKWKRGAYCKPPRNQYRQHPEDYIEGLKVTVKQALQECPAGTAENIAGISVDTTGSTPVAVDKAGTPLALTQGFEGNPNAMFVLWKDHTAVKEADEINRLAKSWGGEDYTRYEGSIYSSEWFWAKILHILREDPRVREAAYSWLEHCDWIPAMLTGENNVHHVKRSRCAAGHKAMWHESWGGLPSEEFLVKLDPLLAGLRERLYTETHTSDVPAGYLSQPWAAELGLPEGVPVGVGAFDAHLGAVGGEVKPYHLTKIVGTSTCDIMVAPEEEAGNTLVKGICGQVDGSVIPGMVGLEAGQSAFGDVYAWFKQLLLWPVENILKHSSLAGNDLKLQLLDEIEEQIIPQLSREAEEIAPSESGILALDWMNGRRTPDANQLLKGAITGISMGTDAPRIFRALVEATAFGSRAIVERFREEGVRIDGIIALGGVAKKSPLVMQILADVLDMPIKVAASEQTCALGSAMAAAVAGGVYRDFPEAQQKMGGGYETEYTPNPAHADAYRELYNQYLKLGSFIEKELSGD